ncbi:ATP-binding protein [Roseovarius spongiae]|uniref:ATP-binding protein n=1 Tax=Roseovarius spongiae TaxID=2320272 RepID=A0A3A8AXN8_9RHOB|nr:ATP-binding protein [Roseovarius spongiae]RKF14881.1 ATP-binding protein [Roseovarius spongiae]
MMRLDTLRDEPFTSVAEHMAAEFRWLDARLSGHLRALRDSGRFDESGLRGLRLDERHVVAALAPSPPRDAPPMDRQREIIDARAAAREPPLYRLARAFGLSAFERRALMIAAAPAFDARYRAALALAQNDATRDYASPDLIIELLEPANRLARLACFTPDAPLLRYRLLTRPTAAATPLADRPLGADDRVAMAMLGHDAGLPSELGQALSRLDPEAEDWAPALLTAELSDKPVIVFDAGRDSGQRALAARRARRAGLGMLCLDAARLGHASVDAAARFLMLAIREARLTDAMLFIDAGALTRDAPTVPALAGLAASENGLVVCAPPDVAHVIASADPDRIARVALPPLDATDRLRWWRAAAAEPDRPEIARLAWRSRLGPAGIGRARGAPAAPMDRPLPAMLRPVRARWTRDDLILSDTLGRQLDELTAFVSNWPKVLGDWGFGAANPQSRHCLALFSGPSGTGKTMAASIVAQAADTPLYRASLASIFDKYLGETEKQIDRLFEAAADAGIAILCDEADALFGARTEMNDAHARYANLTVSHLLQRIEEHEGLVVMTSNLPRNMDEAFARRIGHSLAFTLPDAAARRRLWEGAIPARAALGDDVDLPALAETFELSGGDIRNAALAAAYLAAAQGQVIGMRHLLRAVERELAKIGRTPIAADFGRLDKAR